jgi:hypothetical protein
MLEILDKISVLLREMPTDRVLIVVILVALGLVGYGLHVHLNVVKSLSRGRE